MIPNLFIVSNNELISDEQKSQQKLLVDDIRELSIVLPAIMSRLD